MAANVVFKLFYRSSSIHEMKHVLRPNSRFLKSEARRMSLQRPCQPFEVQPPNQR